MRPLSTVMPAAPVALLAACATLGAPALQPGLSEAEVNARLAPLTGRYALPSGGTRLEYARGPMGRTTWMVDLDAQGRVTRWAQVMDGAYFAQVVDGMPREALLRLLGRPGDRQREYMNRETWYWRYANNDCLVFAVTLNAQGRVVNGGGVMPDPRCELPSAK